MYEFFSSLLLISLLIIFGCDNQEKTSSKAKISESTSSQVLKHNGEVNNKEEIDKVTSINSSANDEEKNRPPELTSIRIAYVTDNDPRGGLKAVIQAKDPDGDEISFKYLWKINGEEIVGATDEALEWQDEFKRGDKITLEVIPFDGKEEGLWRIEGEFSIPNSPPKITSEPEPKMEGGKFGYTVLAEDPDGDPVEYTLKNAPKGMVIEPATGLITWNFDKKDAGEYKIEIIATDPEGAKANQILTLTIP